MEKIALQKAKDIIRWVSLNLKKREITKLLCVSLQFKPELHRIADKLDDRDLRAIMQFVLITCIILPVLPNHSFDPMAWFNLGELPVDVLNPFETWLLVVLIVGMSLGGYIVYKFFGRNAGILLGGILGGAISSTATMVSYSRQARGAESNARAAAIVIMIASTIVFLRVLLEIAIVAPEFLESTVLLYSIPMLGGIAMLIVWPW